MHTAHNRPLHTLSRHPPVGTIHTPCPIWVHGARLPAGTHYSAHAHTHTPVHTDYGHGHVYTGSRVAPLEVPRDPNGCPREDWVQGGDTGFPAWTCPSKPPRSPLLPPLPASTRCFGMTLGGRVSVPGVYECICMYVCMCTHTYTHTSSLEGTRCHPNRLVHLRASLSPHGHPEHTGPQNTHHTHSSTEHMSVLTHHRHTTSCVIGQQFTQGGHTPPNSHP